MQPSKGTADDFWLGALLTGGPTFGVGLLLPMLLYPDSNIAPIMGFFGAPPAALLGGVLGITIAKLPQATPPLAFLGCALVPLLFFAVQTLRHRGPFDGRGWILFAAEALVFGISGAVVAIRARRGR